MSPEKVFFSETGGFILEISPNNIKDVKSKLETSGVNAFEIGTTGGENISINQLINLPVSIAKNAWENGLRNKI